MTETNSGKRSTFGRKSLPFGVEYGIPLTMKAVRAAGFDETLFICGQMDMDAQGIPRGDHSIEEQTLFSLELAYKAAEETGFRRQDVVKLGVHYIASEVSDFPAYKTFVRSKLVDPQTIVTFTALESFPSGDAARVEIDALAIKPMSYSPRLGTFGGGIQAVRQNELAFASIDSELPKCGVQSAGPEVFGSLNAAFCRIDSATSDVCAIWLYIPVGYPSEQLRDLIVSLAAEFPRPAPVLTVVRLAGPSKDMFRIDALAVCGCEKIPAPGYESQFSTAVRAGRYAFVGGHSAEPSVSNKEQRIDHLVDDSHRAMRQFKTALADLGLSMADIVFVNAYFVGRKSMERWSANAQVRSHYYEAPGPAATGVEVSGLYPDDLQLTASCIAMCEAVS